MEHLHGDCSTPVDSDKWSTVDNNYIDKELRSIDRTVYVLQLTLLEICIYLRSEEELRRAMRTEDALQPISY